MFAQQNPQRCRVWREKDSDRHFMHSHMPGQTITDRQTNRECVNIALTLTQNNQYFAAYWFWCGFFSLPFFVPVLSASASVPFGSSCRHYIYLPRVLLPTAGQSKPYSGREITRECVQMRDRKIDTSDFSHTKQKEMDILWFVLSLCLV